MASRQRDATLPDGLYEEQREPTLLRKVGSASVYAGRVVVARLALDLLDRLVAVPPAIAIFVGVVPIAAVAIVAASVALFGTMLLLSFVGALESAALLLPLVFLGTVVISAFFLLRWYVRLIGRRAMQLAERVTESAEAAMLPRPAERPLHPGGNPAANVPSPSPSLAELDVRLAPRSHWDP